MLLCHGWKKLNIGMLVITMPYNILTSIKVSASLKLRLEEENRLRCLNSTLENYKILLAIKN